VKLVRVQLEPFKISTLDSNTKAELNTQMIDFAANSTWSDWKRDIMGNSNFFPAKKSLAQVYDVMNELIWPSWCITIPAQLEPFFVAAYYQSISQYAESYVVTTESTTKLVMRWNGMRSVNNRETWNFFNYPTTLEPVWKF
jgi:hypothetical protein